MKLCLLGPWRSSVIGWEMLFDISEITKVNTVHVLSMRDANYISARSSFFSVKCLSENEFPKNNHHWWSLMTHCFGRRSYAGFCAELHGIIVKRQITSWSRGEESITAHASTFWVSHSEREMSSNLVRCGSASGFCSTSLCKWGMTPSLSCVFRQEDQESTGLRLAMVVWDPPHMTFWSAKALLTDTNSAP